MATKFGGKWVFGIGVLGTAVLSAGGRDTGGVQGAAIPRGLTVVMAIAGIGIVVFATIAAMGG